MNLDFLKPALGDELFAQVATALKNSGLNIVNIADGSYIPKAKFDEQLDKVKALQQTVAERDATIKQEQAKNGTVDALQSKVDQLTKDLADRDATIQSKNLEYQIKDELRGMKARNVDVIMPLLQRDKITVKDGKLEGLSDQVEALKKSDAYLFDTENRGNRGGFSGHQDTGDDGSGGDNPNAAMNHALRAMAGRE